MICSPRALLTNGWVSWGGEDCWEKHGDGKFSHYPKYRGLPGELAIQLDPELFILPIKEVAPALSVNSWRHFPASFSAWVRVSMLPSSSSISSSRMESYSFLVRGTILLWNTWTWERDCVGL